MIPSAEEVASVKAECQKRFGHDRVVGVKYHDPISGEHVATVCLAAFDWAAAVEYQDNRASDVGKARALLFAERQLYPSPEALAPLRAEWAAFALTVETVYRQAMGFSPEDTSPVARPLSPSAAPPGLSAADAKALIASHQGVRLWGVSLPDNGLALVWKQPTSEVWGHSQRVIAEAMRAKAGVLCPALGTMGDHCVWTPDGTLKQHLDKAPGRARDLEVPWDMMGGVAAKASASFL